ncbi:MAG: response regulator transcription factor [Pyrinomonadaceae bacterium]|nr:response regulator transcription factor [Pyrinomonadaceae bacterium]
MNIRTLIVEDEPLARQTLRDFIADFKWLELIGEAVDGLQAIEKIQEAKPALIFLDVQIPEVSGLEVLRRIKYEPAVVFTTAFDHYAVTAFELEALDYLQKPFGRERFHQTIERIRQRLSENKTAILKKQNDENIGPLTTLFVRKKDLIFPLETKNIFWLEANGDYVNIHTRDEKYMASGTLTEFAKRLDENKFLQIHRSSIVNLDQIEKIEELGRTLLLYLKNGAEVQASRSGSQLLKKLVA